MRSKLSRLGEFGLIRRLTGGIGDDASLIRFGGRPLLVTTDMLIEKVHFRLDWSRPDEIGMKAMRVNLSDIAAMGASPKAAFVSVGLPPSFSVRDAECLYQGLDRAAREAGATIEGGDTNVSERVIINVALIGTPGSRVVFRSGARPGDRIYVTGTLGAAALGLASLRVGRKRGMGSFRRRHRVPPNRVAVGRKVARFARSMIDLSDGLIGDLRHVLTASRVGARIDAERLPAPRGLRHAAPALNIDPLRLQLAGGEDYELLFTAPARRKIPAKIAGVRVTPIGTIVPRREGLVICRGGRRRRLSGKLRGFEHFS